MDDVDKVKQKLDIVEYIGRFVSLSRAGRNMRGLCPFHTEKTPSFMVSNERQAWHCFGCQKGGDIFTFFMEYEKADFAESLKALAQEAGVALTQPLYRTEQEKKKDQIYTLNALAAQFYHFLLTQHPVGKGALAYLTEKRSIPRGLIEKFQLGYAPQQGRVLLEYLEKKKKYKKEEIIAAGLASMNRGRTTDFFIHRIIFPIHDVRGNIVAFSGRALDDSTLPKYINTRETLVYKKSNSLYGLFLAKDGIKKENKVLIVEGEFDVISCVKEGIANVVALKGTALTDEQIKLLKRYTGKILFCFDSDIAGTSAQKRSIAMIEKEGLSSAVIIPPEGKDPDELLREHPHLFKKALKEEVSVYDFILNTALQNTNTSTPEGKRKVLDETLPFFSHIENEVIKEHYLKKLATSLDTSYESVQRQSQKSRVVTPSQPTRTQPQPSSREEITETYLLSLILQAKEPHSLIEITRSVFHDTSFSTPALDKLWKELGEYIQNKKEFKLAELSTFLSPELIEPLDKCTLAPIPEFEDEKAYAKEVKRVAVESYSLAIKKKIKDITEEIKELEKSNDDIKITELQKEFSKYTSLLSKVNHTPLE